MLMTSQDKPRSSRPKRTRKGRPADTDSAVTRQSILDASLWAFGSHGYAGTSMQIIAKRAGLTAGTLYHYFPSKAEIFRTVGDDFASELRRRSEAAVANEVTAPTRIAAILRGLGDWILESPETASFILSYASEVTRNREVRRLSPPERWSEPIAYYASFIEEGIERGEIRADLTLDDGGALVQGLVYGLATVVAVSRTFGPPDGVIDAFVQTIEGSLFITPGSIDPV